MPLLYKTQKVFLGENTIYSLINSSFTMLLGKPHPLFTGHFCKTIRINVTYYSPVMHEISIIVIRLPYLPYR
jgi:hypothetical protein